MVWKEKKKFCAEGNCLFVWFFFGKESYVLENTELMGQFKQNYYKLTSEKEGCFGKFFLW
jgi:hypothetical protein